MGIVVPGIVVPGSDASTTNTTATVLVSTTDNVSGPYFAVLGVVFSLLFTLSAFWLVYVQTERMEVNGPDAEKGTPMVASMRKCLCNKAFTILIVSDIVEVSKFKL